MGILEKAFIMILLCKYTVWHIKTENKNLVEPVS